MIKRMFKEAKMMKSRLISHLRSIFGASVLIFATLVVSLQLAQGQALSGNCGMQLGGTVIFCEPFDVVNSGIPSRTGALDPNVWGVSRVIANVTEGQTIYDGWAATQLITCSGTVTVTPPNDVIICNGQLREASNDNPNGGFEEGTVTTLAMYPRQPFDFAGRTGTVSFDVSNNAGPHGAWPEFWFTDAPVPAPFSHFNSWEALPQNGFAVRFDGAAPIGQSGSCPNENNLDKLRVTVDSAAVIRNYVLDDTLGYGPGIVKLTILDCVIEAPEAGDPGQMMNHIELQITPNQIDVYATDAGVVPSAATLKHIAQITSANLTATRGLIWIEDVHYNGDKILDTTRPSMRQNTFAWDNVAFDGPFVGRDFGYDALDNNTIGNDGSTSLGKYAAPGASTSWNVLNVPASPNPAAVKVLFNFYYWADPTSLTVTVNGNVHSVPYPYPDTLAFTWRTLAVTIPVTDLVAGTNVVTIGAPNVDIAVANVDIVLGDVPGGVPVLPGNSRTYPSDGGSSHDFNGDGKSDIAWRDGTNLAFWLMNGAGVTSAGGVSGLPSTWSIVGQRDFNGDGKADLLLRDTSGNIVMWFMNGTTVASTANVGNIPTNWTVVGVADFNGDGLGDILWTDGSGNYAVWLMSGATVLSSAGVGNVPTAWAVVGTGDFNGDGMADILWQDNLGDIAIWFMNGVTVTSSAGVGNVPTNWSIVGTGDFNGDGMADIVWRDTVGDTSIWLMNGAAVLSAGGLGNIPTTWSIALIGDYNGDGMSDLLWRDSSGNTSMWFMSGANVASAVGVGNVATTWTVQSVNAE
jgi:hypothetical protein